MKKTSLFTIIVTCMPALLMAANVDLDDMRANTEKYKDINVALADGYIAPDGNCVSAAAEGLPPELGAMGIHYIHPALLKITGTDPRVNGESTYTDWSQPSVLIYEPQADGSLELVAVENLVFEAAWDAANMGDAPTLNGRAWDHMADDLSTSGDEAHGFMPHFDQHVWLYRENPMGGLMPFNPNVTCEHANN